MDKVIAKLKEARALYDEAKKLATAEYHKLEEIEKEVMNTLKSNGRTKYDAEGVALVSIQSKEVFTVPKDNQSKTELFDYIKNKYGSDALIGMLGINHNTLQGWANREIESDAALQIPGLAKPTSVETLYFRGRK